MALPTIKFNSATGSDTQASGAGPATAKFGTNASFAASVVTLDGSPDLSGVLADGSHVLWMATSTGVQFFKITAVDDGADTVTVTPAPAGTATGRTWAIGGSRRFLETASSRVLFNNGSADGDAKGGWTVQLQSGHAETLASTLRFYGSTDPSNGPITLEGIAGAAVKPVLTFSNNGVAFNPNGATGQPIHFRGFSLRNSNGTKTASVAFAGVNTADSFLVEDVDIGGSSASTSFWKACNNATAAARFINCEIAYCANIGIDGTGTGSVTVTIDSCRIHHCGSHGIATAAGAGVYYIRNNQIYANTGTGILNALTTTTDGYGAFIENNTVDGNAVGINNTGTNQALSALRIVNNLVTNNTGAGIQFTAAAAVINNYGCFVRNNNLYGNGSSYSPAASGLYGLDDPGLDPRYRDRAAFDFRVGNLSLLGEGWPDENLGSAGTAATAAQYRSYAQIGALQRKSTAKLRRLATSLRG